MNLWCCRDCRWMWKLPSTMVQVLECPRCTSHSFLDLGEAPPVSNLKKLAAVVAERYEEAFQEARRREEEAAWKELFRSRYRWSLAIDGQVVYRGTEKEAWKLYETTKKSLTSSHQLRLTNPDGEVVAEEVTRSSSPVLDAYVDGDFSWS